MAPEGQGGAVQNCRWMAPSPPASLVPGPAAALSVLQHTGRRPTSAAWIRSSPRRRTHGSGCPGGQGRGMHGTLNPRTLIPPRPTLQSPTDREHWGTLRARPHPPMLDLAPSCHHWPHPQKSDRGPRTKPYALTEDSHLWSVLPQARPLKLHHVPLCLQTGQVRGRGPRSWKAESELGQTSWLGLHVSASGMGSAWVARARGRLCMQSRCAEHRAMRQGRGPRDWRCGCCCGCIRVALQRDKGRQAGNTEGSSEQRIPASIFRIAEVGEDS